MKFGAVPSVKGLDLSLPSDHPDTAKDVPLAMQFRHTDWYNMESVVMQLCELREAQQ